MKYCLLNISCLLVMLLCANPTFAQEKRTTPTRTNKTTYPDIFAFNRTPLKKALQQVSKWYKIKVNYNHLPNAKVSGAIQKNLDLAVMIDCLNVMSGAKLVLKDGIISNQQ